MNTSTISSNSEERMGTAPIFKLMLSMGIPTFVAQLINLLYNIVDRILPILGMVLLMTRFSNRILSMLPRQADSL